MEAQRAAHSKGIKPQRRVARAGASRACGLRSSATYGFHRTLGTVSLLGPLRMDYDKALRSVRSAAHELSRFVEEAYGND